MKNENDRILLFSQTLSVAMFDSSIVITILGVEPEGKSAHVYLTVSRKRNIVDILTKNVVQPEFDGKAAMQASKESQKKAKKKGILLILGRNQPVNRCFWRFTGAKEK